jgi:hypothetical protein
MSRYGLHAILIGCLVITGISCAQSQPRQRPLKTEPIAEGPGTMESVRKALQGSWSLVSLTVTDANGRSHPVDATGQLTFDGFGNMNVEYRISDAGAKQLATIGVKLKTTVLSTEGNVAIDPQKSSITYVGEDFMKKMMDADLAAQRANPFTLERTRFYNLGADGMLTLATRYDSGAEAAKALWKKSS